MDGALAERVGKDEAGKYIIAGFKGTAPDPRAAGPANETFRQNYTAEYGREPIQFCPHSYDAVAVVALAIEKAGNASGTAIRDSVREVANPPGREVSDIGEALRVIREEPWRDINYQGASGDITFDRNGDVMGSYCEWFIADNGSIMLGNPIEMKGPVVMPTPTPSPSPSPSPTPTPEEGVPGFEAVFAIAGLLAVTYLLRRSG